MIANTYNRLPISFVYGEGVWLFDEQGNKYLDGVAGIAVNTLGHGHPKLVQAISKQAQKLIHTSNLYQIQSQETLAKKLAQISDMKEVFFCNSGAEANEAAIKISRLWGNNKQYQNPQIVVFENAFHGRTMATLSATANSKVQKGFAPLLRGFLRSPINDIEALRNIFSANPEITAVLIEPVQGEGGVYTLELDFIQELRKLCDENDALLMFDEVQCGVARTGNWFAYQQYNVKPDVLTLAKGLGGGVPIGACLTCGKASGVLKPGNHGTTFGGNPLVCAAALAVISAIEEENLLANSTNVGNYLLEQLKLKLKIFENENQKLIYRGKGLMLGVEWFEPITDLPKVALSKQLLTNVTHDKVIRILPPLIFNKDNVDEFINRLIASIKLIYI